MATIKLKKNVSGGVFVIVAICIIFSGCYYPSDEDKRILDQIIKKYEDKYSFEFDGDLCLSVISKTQKSPVSEVKEIYKEFIYIDFKTLSRRKTSYVYLNVYSINSNFLYQLCYDPLQDKFFTDKRPATD